MKPGHQRAIEYVVHCRKGSILAEVSAMGDNSVELIEDWQGFLICSAAYQDDGQIWRPRAWFREVLQLKRYIELQDVMIDLKSQFYRQ